jgi:hypothetical protein
MKKAKLAQHADDETYCMIWVDIRVSQTESYQAYGKYNICPDRLRERFEKPIYLINFPCLDSVYQGGGKLFTVKFFYVDQYYWCSHVIFPSFHHIMQPHYPV